MAKKPKKVSAEPSEGGAEEAPKSKKKLIIMAAAGLLVVLGVGGGFFLMKKGGGDEAKAGESAAHGAAHGEEKKDDKSKITFLDLREMIINLSPDPGSDKARFAKLRVALELKDAKTEAEVKVLAPRIEDALQVYMREVRGSDLAGSVGLYRLREELLRRVNVAVYPAKVDAVLFKDLIVQ
jgi:flagellar FliL protein